MDLARKARNLAFHWRHGGSYRVWQKSCERTLYYLHPFLTPRRFLQLKASVFVGYWARIDQPRSFSEKILYSKLHRPNPMASLLTDKYKVREYVARRAGHDLLSDILWVGRDPEAIPFDELPERFVIKANHGAGFNIFVHSRKDLNKAAVIGQAASWMGITYSNRTRSYESQYDNVDRRIIVERMMIDDEYGIPFDFKFFCFHGEPHFIQLDIDRFGNHRRNIYDSSWDLAPFEIHYRRGRPVRKPGKLSEMLEISRRLSAELDFCRIDMYLINDEDIRFGEITLYPGGGFERFFPRSWDFQMGKLWNIDLPVFRVVETKANG